MRHRMVALVPVLAPAISGSSIYQFGKRVGYRAYPFCRIELCCICNGLGVSESHQASGNQASGNNV